MTEILMVLVVFCVAARAIAAAMRDERAILDGAGVRAVPGTDRAPHGPAGTGRAVRWRVTYRNGRRSVTADYDAPTEALALHAYLRDGGSPHAVLSVTPVPAP